jgi:hypothetical protein
MYNMLIRGSTLSLSKLSALTHMYAFILSILGLGLFFALHAVYET